MVREFNEAIGVAVRDTPGLPVLSDRMLAATLIHEEAEELVTALEEGDLIEIADGIADVLVVALGAAARCGIDVLPIFEEVHKTNMAKVNGPIRADGKRQKPPGWKPPEVGWLLGEQGWEPED